MMVDKQGRPSAGFASRRGYRGHGAAPAMPKTIEGGGVMAHVTTPDEAEERVKPVVERLMALGLIDLATIVVEAARGVPYLTDDDYHTVESLLEEVERIEGWKMAEDEREHEERGEQPYVRGMAAIWNPDKPTFGIFSHWQCPHCGANLSRDTRICLNACGLSAASRERFNREMVEAIKQVNEMEEIGG
jgi:predicted nucleic acid-binding Zn ribbon protein